MSSVDDRIVNMQFNNKDFQSGAAESTKSLETLEKTIGGMGTGTGLTTMGKNVDGIRAKFSALQVAGVTALATIVNKAVLAGLQLLKSFTITPILDGFHEYETNLNSIQTIMANTGKTVKVVNGYLNQLNHYSDLTIYSFSTMAEAIGKFTSAGVGLSAATSAIKGMANTAALSGSNVQQLNTAMYQMSQALSTGTIRLMDWNSLANAGMGGSNIREALMATNRTLGDNGKAMDDAIKSAGSFRDSLAAGWLSAQTFNKTMKVMAGVTGQGGKTIAYTVEQLQKMGYSKDAAKQLNTLSQAAIDSATKVKTFTQLIDVVKESIGSGWAKIFQDLFGNFTQATKMWTGVSQNITGVVSTIFKNVDKMLQGWRKLGGYQDLWTGFGNIFKSIGNLIMPFVDAFKAVLPATATAGSGLAKVTKAFADVTGWIEKITSGASVLTPVLISLFSIFKVFGSIIGAVVSGLQPLFVLLGKIAGVAGNALAQGAEIGNNLVQGLLQGINPAAIEAAVTQFANNIVTWIKSALGIHSPAAELIPVGIAIVQGVAEGIANSVSFILDAMGTMLSAIFDGIKQLFGGMDAFDWATLMNAILTGGLLLSLRGLTKTLSGFVGGITSALNNITSPFAEVTNTLKAMQQEIKARIILDIAIAVGILAAALIALSLIQPKKLATGLGALSALLGELVGSLFLLSKIDAKGLAAMSFAILTISTAMLLLSAAVAILGNLDMSTLAKGLGAIGVALALMVGSLKFMSGLGAGLPAAAAGMLIMATAMVVMSGAIATLGNMDMGTLAKGLGAIAIGLGLFVAALVILSKAGPAVGAGAGGILIMSTAMVVLAGAVATLGNMNMSTLAKGLGAIAVGLTLFVAAIAVMAAMGPEAGVGAGGILLMATAMVAMSVAVGTLGSMSLGELAKGLGAMAAGLAIFLLAAAAAIPLAPGLIILGASVLALGAGLALAGAGMLAFATGFSLMAVVGTAGIAVLVAGFEAFMALLPQFAVQVAAAFVTFIETIAKASPRIRAAFSTIFKNMLGVVKDAIPQIRDLINTLLDAIINIVVTNIPKYGKVITTLITTGINVIKNAVPRMVTAGTEIIVGILQGIAKNVPKMITAGTNIVIAFIQGIGKAAAKIAEAAFETLLKFIQALTKAVNAYAPQLQAAGAQLAYAIADGLTFGLLSKVGDVVNAGKDLAGNVIGAIGDAFGIGSPSKVAHHWGELVVEGLANGIRDSASRAVAEAVAMANAVIAAGDKVIRAAQNAASKRQAAADRAQARADISAQQAKDAAKLAKQHPKNKALEKAAKEAQKLADKQQKAADQIQKAADKAAQHVQNVQSFREADAQGKGDILRNRAQALSDRAVQALAKANAEANAAKKLQGQARKDMLKQAREDAKTARKLANQSKDDQKKANEYYAQSVQDRIDAIIKARKAEAQSEREQRRFDNSTDEQKADILAKRAKADQKRADLAQKQSEDFLKQARKLEKTNAAKAQRLLDRAEKKAQEAKDAASQAKDESDQAKQLRDQANQGTDTSVTPGVTISHTALEDAAKAIDRYTESLQQAEADAVAGRGAPQFVQNNYSPESLSPSTVYRNTKNLLTAQEIKMAAPD